MCLWQFAIIVKICSMTLEGNNGDGDDVKVEGAMVEMRLLGNLGRYGIQPFRISYKMGVNNNNNNNDSDKEAEEADGMPMMHCMTYHTLTGGHID
jgi:hypothetical protein